MDLFEYIGSRDVRKYLKDINFKFNSIEAAWLIWQYSKSFEELRVGLYWILENMEDYEIYNPYKEERWDRTLHEDIRIQLQIEADDFDDFWQKETSYLTRMLLDFPTPFKKGDLIIQYWEQQDLQDFERSLDHGVGIFNGNPRKLSGDKLFRFADFCQDLEDGTLIYCDEKGEPYSGTPNIRFIYEYYREELTGTVKDKKLLEISHKLKENGNY